MRLVGLIIALLLAVGAAYVVISVMQKPAPVAVVQTSTKPDFQSTPILVAAKAIPIGEVITPDMVRSQDWPQHLVLEGFVTSGDKSKGLIGMVTRSQFQEGEPILMTKLSNPEDPNFLAAGLPEGEKVATISVDSISSVAGFIYPGDHVDVLLTHELPNPDAEDANGQKQKEKVTETLLSNIKVLAVDSHATAGDQTQTPATPNTNQPEKKAPASVSLEVSLADAQRLRLAQETGYVSLALRSLKDKEKKDTTDPTHVQNLTLTSAYGTGEKNKDNEPIRVVRGNKVEEVKMDGSGGGDAANPVGVSTTSSGGSTSVTGAHAMGQDNTSRAGHGSSGGRR